MKNTFKYIGLFGLLLLLVATTAFGQVNRTVRVGAMEINPGENPGDLSLRYPRTWNQNNVTEAVSSVHGFNLACKRTWTDPSGVSWDVQVAQGVSSKYTDIENVTVPVKDKFKRTFRDRPGKRLIDGRDWTDIQNQSDPVEPNLPADVVTYTHWTTWTGMDVERYTYSFANATHDDYVIVEYVITNKSGETREDVYYSTITELATDAHYPGNIWSNYYGADYATGGDSLRLFYAWDADEIASPQDDKGDPDQIWGNLEKPQYLGMACLHADTSPSDETDDPAQPHKAGWSQRELMPSLSEAGHTEIYEFMSDVWNPANPDLKTVGNGKYRVQMDTWQEHVSNPVTEQAKVGSMHFGPYTLANNEDIRIVIAYVGGTINDRLAIDVGRAYNSGYSSLKNVPMPYDFKDSKGNVVIACKGRLLTQAEKDQIIDTGRDSLFANASKATHAWKNGNVKRATGSFNIPMAPPTPSLTLTSMPGKLIVEWGNEADAVAKGFRIYRNYLRPPEWTFPTDTQFVKIADLSASSHSYEDTDVIRGQSYYFILTALNDQNVESSVFLNRSGQLKGGEERLEEAVEPTRPPDANWKDNVVVVPNPFHARAAYKYEGRKLNFLNTPAHCKIHIYTMTGDKVMTLDHTSGTGDELWDRQDTFSTMEIVSGIYLFVVEEYDGPNGSPTGETAIGKFVVVK